MRTFHGGSEGLPRPARLEDWMRRHYHASPIDVGSSGVEEYSFKEVREMAGITAAELDSIVLRDGHSLGTEGLRAAVLGRHPASAASRVMVTHGSSEATYLVMRTLLRAGDEVVALRPVYQQLVGVAEAAGCKLVHWSLGRGGGFAASLDRLRGLMGARTRMVVVNFPHNPTGCTLTRDEQRELVRLCAKAGAYLVWDAAFRDLALDDPPLDDPTALYERAISLGTLSKAFGLPGLRVGWLLADASIVGKLVELRDYVTLHLSPLVEFIAERVLRNADRFVVPRREQARRNRAAVNRWLRKADDCEWTEPKGGVCGLVRLHGLANTDELCRRLAVEHGVLVVPGSCFGQPRHVRLGFGGSERQLRLGLRRISECLRRLRVGAGGRDGAAELTGGLR